MIGVLTNNQREYVLFHLNQHILLTPALKDRFVYVSNSEELGRYSNRIVFLFCENPIQVHELRYIHELPVLFPTSDREDFLYFDGSGNLVFSHDLLKTVFYLLSGYQEYANRDSKDRLNRFDYADSIQKKTNCIHKPIVNYYFNEIANGIEQFCSINKIAVQKRSLFKNFGFLLSHDIDAVDLYTFNFLLYKVKEIIGLVPSRLSRLSNLKLLLSGFLKWSRIIENDNPYFNFTFMRSIERMYNFRSTFYFLDRGISHSDASYSFSEVRMKNLYAFLQNENCEIGLHGTVESIYSLEKMKSSLTKLEQASGLKIIGIRQHRLLWDHPQTANIQKAVGFHYDTTLGFAAHQGFRNSYCYPFKLYNFEKDETINLWEFPLNVMDVTLFFYQNYSTSEAAKKITEIIVEVQKFGGIFTLLWHNSFFDENTYPGITEFYKNILDQIARTGSENLLASELLDKLENQSAHD